METTIEERIKLFRIVREIPYYISVGQEQDFSCSTKAEILQKLLRLQSRYRICEFRWEDLKLPQEILRCNHENPETHQFLEVFVPETQKWIIVDPTWDSKLASIFPINNWDGLHDTKIAVPTQKIYSTSESEEFIVRTNTPMEIENYMKRNEKFLVAVNKHLDQVRNNFIS